MAINGNGVAVGRPLLANARVLGPVGAGTWNVGGKTARMSLGSTASQWTGNFGDVAGFVVAGDLSGTLSADSIRTLSAGTLTNADVFLNRPAAPRALGLGRLAARGAITDTLVRANADIGTVTAAALVGTSLCAGVTGMERGVLPAGPSDFFAPSSIRAVSLRGGAAATPTFVAGIIAAQNLGRLSLGSVNVNNGGAAFGVAADTVASLAGVTTDGAPIRGARLDQPSQSVDLTDFEVRVF